MEIHLDLKSLDRTQFGLVTGVIFFQEKDYYFPDSNWNDSILFILNTLCENIIQKQSFFEVLYMEVSCEVHITIDYNENNISFSFKEREKEVEYESVDKFSTFLKILIKALNKLVRESNILTDVERDKYTLYMKELNNIKKIYG